MKTAMQELYEEIEKLKAITYTVSITDIQRVIGNYYIEKEKEQIINAYKEGLNSDCLQEQNEFFFAEAYYKETYKN
jgi:predicted RND superfamily exporter protein